MQTKQLGKYQLIEQLGGGGFGVVYKAQDGIGRLVALKVLKPQWAGDNEAIARFRQEALAAGSLFHQRIATILDLDEADGRLFLSMRYVDGRSLEAILEERGSLPWEEALQVTRQVAEGLAYAHQQGLIHRDIKPGNILIGKDGAVLTDFGLVKAATASGMSRTSGVIGTPHYISPEIWRNKNITVKADVYSLACVLFEMVVGKKLFDGDSAPAVMAQHCLDGAQLPEVWPEGCPAELKSILEGALNPDPEKRLELGEFVDALSQRRPTPKEPTKVLKPTTLRQTEPDSILEPTKLRQTEPHFSKPIISSNNEKVIKLVDGVEMAFVCVPAGVFWMGSDENDPDADKDEKPKHKVYLDEYWIGKYPVTNAQYVEFVKAKGHETPFSWESGMIPESKRNHPVVHVSWLDAQAFCEWATQVSGRAIYLPSEAQWEKAARGTDGRKYPWGNEAPGVQLLNYDNYIGDTTEVGIYPANVSPYGAYDMAGNVWEWVPNRYDNDYYSKVPPKNPSRPSSRDKRVLRGGSWGISVRFVRSAYCLRFSPDYGSSDVGFRCVILP